MQSESLARVIVYSMAPDGMPSPASNAPTPLFTPLPSGMNTPQIPTQHSLRDYLSAPLGAGPAKHTTYLAGSKALESLSQIIASTESFFHPSNSGPFTNDVCINTSSESRGFVCLQRLTENPAGCIHQIHSIRLQSTYIDLDLLVISPSHLCTGWLEEQQPDCKTPTV